MEDTYTREERKQIVKEALRELYNERCKDFQKGFKTGVRWVIGVVSAWLVMKMMAYSLAHLEWK